MERGGQTSFANHIGAAARILIMQELSCRHCRGVDGIEGNIESNPLQACKKVAWGIERVIRQYEKLRADFLKTTNEIVRARYDLRPQHEHAIHVADIVFRHID